MTISRRALLAGLPSLLLLSCSRGSGQAVVPPPSPAILPSPPAAVPDVREIIGAASIALAQVRSFRFTITHSEGVAPLGLGLTMSSAQGEVVAPDRIRLKVIGRAGEQDVRYEVVGIGPQTWMTNPFTSQWQELPGLTLRHLVNPQYWSVPLVTLSAPVLTGVERLGMMPSYVIEGTIDTSVLRALIPVSGASRSIALRLWVDQQSSMPRRVAISGPLWSDDSPNVVRTLELSDFNQAIQIDIPV